MSALLKIFSFFPFLLILIFDSLLIFYQTLIKEFDLDSFFLGLISILLAIVGYLTKKAAEKNELILEKLGNKLIVLDKRLVAIETRLKIENGIEDADIS